MGRIDYSSNHKVQKTNKKLMQITKKIEDSLQEVEKSPNLTRNLKCLQKDFASDYPQQKLRLHHYTKKLKNSKNAVTKTKNYV